MAICRARPGRITLEIGSGAHAGSVTHYEEWKRLRKPGDRLILSDAGFRIAKPAALPTELKACITPNGAGAFGTAHGTLNGLRIREVDGGSVWFMRQTLPHLDFNDASVHEVVVNNLFSDGYSGYSPYSIFHLVMPRRISTAVREIDRIVKPGGRFAVSDSLAPHLVLWGAIKNELEKLGWTVDVKVSKGKPSNDTSAAYGLVACKPRA